MIGATDIADAALRGLGEYRAPFGEEVMPSAKSAY